MPGGSRLSVMRNWEPKEVSRTPASVEPDEPGAEGSTWEQYGPAVLAVILVIVTAGVCGAIVTFR
jgi:hypothetical protein